MRNIETRSNKIGPDDAGLNQMLTEARMEERRARAAAMAARLDSLACHITSRQLNHVEAAKAAARCCGKHPERSAGDPLMADSMDLVQQRVEEERQRHIHTARSKEPGVSAFYASNVMRQSRPLAAVRFPACSAASPVRKSQS